MSSSTEADLQPEQEAPPPRRRGWMRRVAYLFLVVGIALSAGTFLRQLPKERQIELRLENAATIVALDVTWTEAGPGARAPVQGSSWRFAEGTAPRTLVTTVRLPDGAYSLDIEVDRTLGSDATQRTVTLGDSDRIALPVR